MKNSNQINLFWEEVEIMQTYHRMNLKQFKINVDANCQLLSERRKGNDSGTVEFF